VAGPGWGLRPMAACPAEREPWEKDGGTSEVSGLVICGIGGAEVADRILERARKSDASSGER
jgi:hypothetical protein